MAADILASICPLKLSNTHNNRYCGYAYMNLIKTKKKHYLNILCKIRMKSQGQWLEIDEINVHLPIPALAMMYNYIKKIKTIRYQTTRSTKWTFRTNETKDTAETKD